MIYIIGFKTFLNTSISKLGFNTTYQANNHLRNFAGVIERATDALSIAQYCSKCIIIAICSKYKLWRNGY
jgi:hypothetical protein